MKKVQLIPRRRPFMLCVKKDTPAHEVRVMLRDMADMMRVPVPSRDIEVRYIRPMTLGIDEKLLSQD